MFREKYFWFILFHHDRIWCDLSDLQPVPIFGTVLQSVQPKNLTVGKEPV